LSAAASAATIGAYYYPWYANNFHGGQYVRRDLVPPQYPMLGEYNDRDSSVLSQHMAWSRQANISVWAASWWGAGGTDDVTLLKYILPHSDLGDIKIAIHYETQGRTNEYTNFDSQYSDIKYLAANYFGHANYYRIDGRPVLFLYQAGVMFLFGLLDTVVSQMRSAAAAYGYDLYIIGDGAWGPPDQDVLEGISLVDALTNYDVYGSMGATGYAGQRAVNQYYTYQKQWRKLTQSIGKSFVPAAMPGFNDKGVRDGNTPLSRQLTQNSDYGTLFQAMVSQAVQLIDPTCDNLLMIVSFNEWHEDTQIEPVSVADATNVDMSSTGNAYTYGLAYEGYGEKYLDILKVATTSSTSYYYSYSAPFAHLYYRWLGAVGLFSFTLVAAAFVLALKRLRSSHSSPNMDTSDLLSPQNDNNRTLSQSKRKKSKKKTRDTLRNNHSGFLS
jgi:glycoprotein endo-alpha-1,2-mannosidase